MPLLRRAVTAFNEREIPPEQLRWLWLAHIVAGHLWDEQTLDTIHHVDMARDSGALATLPLALATRMGAHVLMGDLPAAAVLLEAVNAVTEVTGISPPPMAHCCLPPGRAASPKSLALVQATTAEAVRRREGFGLIITGFAEATLGNSLRRYEEAARAAEIGEKLPSRDGCRALGCARRTRRGSDSKWTIRARPIAAFRDLAVTTQAAGSDWALGMEARSHALLSVGAKAEAAYKEAIDRLDRTQIRGELARAHLLYGEWLRREKRRAEAGTDFAWLTACLPKWGWMPSARAASELRATGETVRERSPATLSQLTAQETQVARLASEGLSNPEIGTRLFISARTVQYHLSKVFTKMNLTSRNQLSRALDGGRGAANLRSRVPRPMTPLLVTSANGANGDGYGAILGFSADGSLIGPFSQDRRITDPRGLSHDPTSELVYVNSGDDRVLALDRRGGVALDSGRIDDLDPGGAVFGPDGRYYVGLRRRRTILALPPRLDRVGETILPDGTVPFPRGFGFGPDGDLYLASGVGPSGEGDNTIAVFNHRELCAHPGSSTTLS